MVQFNVGDKVCIAGFTRETGTIISQIVGTNNFVVKLDSDPTILLNVNLLDLSHVVKR